MISLTEKELKQLKALKSEVELIAKEIVNIRPEYVVDSAKDYRSGYPHNIIIKGYSNEKLIQLREKLEKKQLLLQRKIYKLEEWLDNVEDSEMRQILRLRYRRGLTWNEIAKELHYSDESVPRKRHERFLNDR